MQKKKKKVKRRYISGQLFFRKKKQSIKQLFNYKSKSQITETNLHVIEEKDESISSSDQDNSLD